MNFKITLRAKNKARRIRIRHERKWLPIRIISFLTGCIAVLSLIIFLEFIPFDSPDTISPMLFAICLQLTVILRVFMYSFTSRCIQDRLNEKLWLTNNVLYHFQQFSVGVYIRHIGQSGVVLAFQIDSIRDVVYDKKSKRIEFLADGEGYDYSDVDRKIIDRKWICKGYKAVFYDYFEPSLINTLRDQGLHIEDKEINEYSIFSNAI